MIGGYADSRGMCVLAKRHVSTLNHYKTRNLSHFWSVLKWIELEMNGMDLGSKGQTPHVGARLKALDEAVLMAASDFSCNFFHFPRPRIWTMCRDQSYYWFKRKRCGKKIVILTKPFLIDFHWIFGLLNLSVHSKVCAVDAPLATNRHKAQ